MVNLGATKKTRTNIKIEMSTRGNRIAHSQISKWFYHRGSSRIMSAQWNKTWDRTWPATEEPVGAVESIFKPIHSTTRRMRDGIFDATYSAGCWWSDSASFWMNWMLTHERVKSREAEVNSHAEVAFNKGAFRNLCQQNLHSGTEEGFPKTSPGTQTKGHHPAEVKGSRGNRFYLRQ